MTMKGLEAEKPLVGKSESPAPQFDVMKLMGEFKQLHSESSKHGNDHASKQQESLSDVLKKSEPQTLHPGSQLDMGTMVDLYGEQSHAHSRPHAAIGKPHAKEENLDEIVKALQKANYESRNDDTFLHPTDKQIDQIAKEIHAEFKRTVIWVDGLDQVK